MLSYEQKQLEQIKIIEEKFKKGETPSTIVQPVKDYVNDNRICLTSITFIPLKIEELILNQIIKPLKKADSRQYFYIPHSFHLTIQNIRTINKPPLFNQQDIENAKKVFKKVIPKYPSFSFEIKRLFELPTSLSLSAFSEKIFADLVLELRSELIKNNVPDNKTYASNDIMFGNITIVRYTKPPNNSFFEKVKELKNIEIGKLEIKTISLITTNSVCHPNSTKIISEYKIK